jgi:hypothetical protein
MLSAGDMTEADRDVHLSRVSDEDLLQTIRHNVEAVYTEVLHIPVPDRVVAILGRLDIASQTLSLQGSSSTGPDAGIVTPAL